MSKLLLAVPIYFQGYPRIALMLRERGMTQQ